MCASCKKTASSQSKVSQTVLKTPLLRIDHLKDCVLVLRLLQKARLKRNNAVVIRDSLRNEMSKRTKTEEENREKREQLVRIFLLLKK